MEYQSVLASKPAVVIADAEGRRHRNGPLNAEHVHDRPFQINEGEARAAKSLHGTTPAQWRAEVALPSFRSGLGAENRKRRLEFGGKVFLQRRAAVQSWSAALIGYPLQVGCEQPPRNYNRRVVRPGAVAVLKIHGPVQTPLPCLQRREGNHGNEGSSFGPKLSNC